MRNNLSAQQQFLRYTYAVESISAALRTRNKNGKIYAPGVIEKRREEFKKHLLWYVLNLWPDVSYLSKEEMLLEIEKLSNDLSSQFEDILNGGRFRIGVSQKVLCLFAKFLWVSGQLQNPPPLIPYDGIVKEKIGLMVIPNWTVLDSMEEYNEVIDEIESVSDGRPAEWELEQWNDAVIPEEPIPYMRFLELLEDNRKEDK